MEKSEPSLVPEWLKGSGASSPLTSLHRQQQDERGQAFNRQQHTSRYPSSRRLNNTGNWFPNERVPYDRDIYGSRGHPSSAREAPPYRSNPEFFDGERVIHQREWDSNVDRLEASEKVSARWRDHELRPASGKISGSFRENGVESGGVGTRAGFRASGDVEPGRKVTFERSFPSLGAQQKPSSGVVYSSLADVGVLSPRQLWQSQYQVRDETPSFDPRRADPSGAPAPPTAPKMVEALLQNPPRVKTPPEMSAEAQRREELQLRQSRQLVPVMPKTMNLINSRDKAKSKLTSKAHQPLSSPTPRPASTRAEKPNLHVLKPGSNGVSLGNAAPPRKPAAPQFTPSTRVNSNRPRSRENGEDKRLNAQAQNRVDFFNTIRKKTAGAGASSTDDPKVEINNAMAVAGVESDEKLGASGDDASPPSAENTSDTDDKQAPEPVANGEHSSIRGIVVGSEEEENRFLRSLGWVEDAGREGELTEEEISAFYEEVQEHMRSKTCSPLSSVRRLQNAVMSFRCTEAASRS